MKPGFWEQIILRFWYTKHPARWLLWPFAWIYGALMLIRQNLLRRFFCYQAPIPVIVVGNLTVGGVGKTPLVIALVKPLQARGFKVGIVSRGYGSLIKTGTHLVDKNDSALLVGDEPLLLAQKTNVPVIIAKDRSLAVKQLMQQHAVNVIISDDGLQHERMGRKIEIAVIDGERGLGNGLCIPAGPLREWPQRLNSVDFVVFNGHSPLMSNNASSYIMEIRPKKIISLTYPEKELPISPLTKFSALAGIGNPERFFNILKKLNINFTPYIFPNHYAFKQKDLKGLLPPIIMTEKDAVKCSDLSIDDIYALSVEAVLPENFWDALWRKMDE